MRGAERATIAGEELVLLPARAVWWPARSTLLVADLHLGKGAAFRAAGVPVPEAATDADLSRLSALIRVTEAARLVLLGDLIHARSGRQPGTLDAVSRWRAGHPLVAMVLIRGNHDERAGDPPLDWGIEVHDGPYMDSPFVYLHEPRSHAAGFVLAGHLHPAVALEGPGSAGFKAPCLWIRHQERIGVLPAFGSFTGTKAFRPESGDGVYVFGSEEVVRMETQPAAMAAPAVGPGPRRARR